MKRILITFIAVAFGFSGFGQVCDGLIVTTSPAEPTANDEITLTVEFTCSEFDQWGEEDIYLWVWAEGLEDPVGLPNMFPDQDDVEPTNGLGDEAWKNSNPYLQMEKIGDKTYQYVFTPTVMFDRNPSDLEYMGFLCKPKDGGGYGDPDMKTEDQEIEFKSLEFLEKLGRTFPGTVSANDFVTIYFNQGLSNDPAVSTYNGDLWITITPYVKNTPAGNAVTFPTKTQPRGNFTEYFVTIIPNEHLDLSNLQDDEEITEIIYYFHNELETFKSEEFDKDFVKVK
ncbi:MAG: hypothetical protein ACLFNU_00115 [Bacteroidales bacterium]